MSQCQASPKKKNTSKGGGENHCVDSDTEHQPTPCKRSKQVTRHRASQEPPRRPRLKGGGMLHALQNLRFYFLTESI